MSKADPDVTTTTGIRLAIDIGGTFTDLEGMELSTGTRFSHKVPTTPDDFSIGFMDAIEGAGRRFGFAGHDIRLVMHGTTIATNAVLTRNLPDGALITTRGFEDVLEIGRHVRKDVYGLKPEARSLLIPRRRRFGITERMGAKGEVVTALDERSLDDVIGKIGTNGVTVVAVCLINAYLNPAHEIAVRARLEAALPGVRVSCSHEVSPEIREFERTSTTVLNALLMPVVQTYIERLTARMRDAGLQAPLYLIQSNGGATTPAAAAKAPVKLLLSGPSGGVLAAERLAAGLELPHIVGVDMGGTSYDVALVQNGKRAIIGQGEIDGLPVRVPMVEMRTIGAGGGSIALADAGRRLKVGPESAGAKPGPVCYGRGGTLPTTTDANVILGRLDAAGFMNGAFPLDADAARVAMKRVVADPLGLSLERAAEGVLTVLNAKLAGAIKLTLFERGLDPRDFALMSFGGAGGLHATEVAAELGMTKVVFPRNPSTFSAHGILQSDIVHDLARARITRLDADAPTVLNRLMAELEAEGRALLGADNLPSDATGVSFSADLRYRGQAFELMLPLEAGPVDVAAVASLMQRFHALHRQRFSFDDPGEAIEMVTLRLAATGTLGGYQPHRMDDRPLDARADTARSVYLGGRWQSVAIIRQDKLGPDDFINGPAIIEQDYTSLLILEGWRLGITSNGDMVAERVEAMP
jgi:N-methylhydantoinase A